MKRLERHVEEERLRAVTERGQRRSVPEFDGEAKTEADRIATAILRMLSTLKWLDDDHSILPQHHDRAMVREAVEAFDKPDLRTELTRRLYSSRSPIDLEKASERIDEYVPEFIDAARSIDPAAQIDALLRRFADELAKILKGE